MHVYLEAFWGYFFWYDPCKNARVKFILWSGLIVHFECRLIFSERFVKAVNYDFAQVFSVSSQSVWVPCSLPRVKAHWQSCEEGPRLCIQLIRTCLTATAARQVCFLHNRIHPWLVLHPSFPPISSLSSPPSPNPTQSSSGCLSSVSPSSSLAYVLLFCVSFLFHFAAVLLPVWATGEFFFFCIVLSGV